MIDPLIAVLPLDVAAQIEDGVLQDLLINLGRAKERHRPLVERFPPWNDPDFDINKFIRACDEMAAASEMMWGYLLDRIPAVDGLPPRHREILCLGVMCRLFRYSAVVRPSTPLKSRGGHSWGVSVEIVDREGKKLTESFGASGMFDPKDSSAALGSYYAATAEAFRDAARTLFPFGAPRDSEGEIVAIDPDTKEPG